MSGWAAQLTGDIAGFLGEVSEQGARAQDVSPVLDGAAHDLHNEHMRSIFLSEGGESRDGRWRPLSPNSARGPGILRQTGDLMRSYSERSHSAHVYTVGKLSVEAGSRHRFARIHEFGGRRIPRRSAQKSDRQHEAWAAVVWRYVLTGEGT